MKINYQRILCLAAGASLALGTWALPVKVSVPASQTEFESAWKQILPEGAAAWEYVAAETPYVQVHATNDYNSLGNGPALLYATPVHATAGEIYKLKAEATTSDYDYDHKYVIVYSTDGTTYTTVGTSYNNDISVYNNRGDVPVFKSSEKELTIPADGDYYFGVMVRGGRSNTTSYFLFKSLTYEKKVDFPNKVTGMKVARPESAALEATITWKWPTKSDANATLEAVSAKIYRQTTSSFNADEAVLVADIKDGKPGEEASYTDNATNNPDAAITAPGKYYWFIQTYQGDGLNPSTTYEDAWVGEDVKCLNIVDKDSKLELEGNGFKITFPMRMEGYNGGWVDPEKVFLKITRQKDNGEQKVINAHYTEGSPFIDPEVEGAGKYTYRLYVMYGVDDEDHQSAECKLGPVFGGGALELPFSENFSDYSSLDNFTILASNSSYKWTRNYSGYLKFNTSSYSKGKSNALTPPLKLEAGKTYRISCNSWVDEAEEEDDWGYGGYTSPVPQDLAITAGTVASDAGQAVVLTKNINVGSSDKETVEAFFSPETTGNYYIGFQAEFQNSNAIYLDDIAIEESIVLPADIADLKAVADATGEKKAAVSFTIPDKTNAGLPLAELTRVVVSRLAEGEDAPVVVKTIEGEECVPGKAVSFDDVVPVENNYTYSAVAEMGESSSNAVSTEKMWIGYDVPKAVSGFTISTSLDETTGLPTVKWTALSGTIAQHGGYIDMDNLKYNVYRVAGKSDKGEKTLVGSTREATFTDTEANELHYGIYRYAVSVVNGEMESAVSFCNNSKTFGDAVALSEISVADEAAVEAWDCRGFMHGSDDVFACYNKNEAGSNEYTAVTPPFYLKDANVASLAISMDLSRYNEEYEESLEFSLVRILPREESEQPAARVAAADQEIALGSVTVTALAEAPQSHAITYDEAEAGKYRLKIRMTSPYNKGVRIHTLSLAETDPTGVSEIAAAEGLAYDAASGLVLLGEGIVSAEAYSADGKRVAAAEAPAALDLSGLAPGLYVVRALRADGTAASLKLMR